MIAGVFREIKEFDINTLKKAKPIKRLSVMGEIKKFQVKELKTSKTRIVKEVLEEIRQFDKSANLSYIFLHPKCQSDMLSEIRSFQKTNLARIHSQRNRTKLLQDIKDFPKDKLAKKELLFNEIKMFDQRFLNHVEPPTNREFFIQRLKVMHHIENGQGSVLANGFTSKNRTELLQRVRTFNKKSLRLTASRNLMNLKSQIRKNEKRLVNRGLLLRQIREFHDYKSLKRTITQTNFASEWKVFLESVRMPYLFMVKGGNHKVKTKCNRTLMQEIRNEKSLKFKNGKTICFQDVLQDVRNFNKKKLLQMNKLFEDIRKISRAGYIIHQPKFKYQNCYESLLWRANIILQVKKFNAFWLDCMYGTSDKSALFQEIRTNQKPFLKRSQKKSFSMEKFKNEIASFDRKTLKSRNDLMEEIRSFKTWKLRVEVETSDRFLGFIRLLGSVKKFNKAHLKKNNYKTRESLIMDREKVLSSIRTFPNGRKLYYSGGSKNIQEMLKCIRVFPLYYLRYTGVPKCIQNLNTDIRNSLILRTSGYLAVCKQDLMTEIRSKSFLKKPNLSDQIINFERSSLNKVQKPKNRLNLLSQIRKNGLNGSQNKNLLAKRNDLMKEIKMFFKNTLNYVQMEIKSNSLERSLLDFGIRKFDKFNGLKRINGVKDRYELLKEIRNLNRN